MFTGIIRHLGSLLATDLVDGTSGLRRVTISCDFADALRVDESVSVNGVCLTVTQVTPGAFTAHVVPETLSKTTLGALDVGAELNLERALRMDEGLGGHLVQGHVDTVGTIDSISDEGGDRKVWIHCPTGWADHLIDRGSITVDGVSLTIARCEPSRDRFMVAIIPYTWENTLFRHYRQGDNVNLEFDVIGKYVLRFLQNREAR